MSTIEKNAPTLKSKLNKAEIKRQSVLLIIAGLYVIYGIIFYYLPLFGWIMAFQNYKLKDGFFGSEFVGLKWFKFLFEDKTFIRILRNTLAMGVINLVATTVTAIGFAILLSEVRNMMGKKIVQTISYLPHFLSMIILTGIVFDVLSMENGMLNNFLIGIGVIDKPIQWLAESKYFWWIVGFANRWKETGWDSIIYLAAITSINPDLYEAASIDGAGRLSRIWHITLPGLKPTILILLIMNVGNVLNVGFELQYLLGNDLVKSVAETIDIYVLNYGISKSNYSLGVAAGIFKSVVSIILVFIANTSAKAMGEESLY